MRAQTHIHAEDCIIVIKSKDKAWPTTVHAKFGPGLQFYMLNLARAAVLCASFGPGQSSVFYLGSG